VVPAAGPAQLREPPGRGHDEIRLLPQFQPRGGGGGSAPSSSSSSSSASSSSAMLSAMPATATSSAVAGGSSLRFLPAAGFFRNRLVMAGWAGLGWVDGASEKF
jgi:hypothetical protein